MARCRNRFADARVGSAELSRPEFDILTALRRIGGEVPPGCLARETFATPAAVTKRVRGLETRGWSAGASISAIVGWPTSHSPTPAGR